MPAVVAVVGAHQEEARAVCCQQHRQLQSKEEEYEVISRNVYYRTAKQVNYVVNKYIQEKYHAQTKTAVLWKKECSSIDADFIAQLMPSNAWIVQPFENVEKL